MAGAIVQAIGQGTPTPAAFQDFTIAPVGAGNALIAVGVAFAGTTRSFQNGGGTWIQVDDDGANFDVWINYNPTAGTTSVRQDNGGTSAALIGIVMEVSGLLLNGRRFKGGQSNGATAAWTAAAIAPLSSPDLFCLGTCYNSSDKTPLCTAGAGWTGVPGTNLSAGNFADLINADVLFAETGNFSHTLSIAASGLWGSAVNYLFANTYGFDIAPVAPSGPSLMGHNIFVTA